MRVLVDLRSHLIANPLITQVEKVPAPGTPTPINGKYVLPIIPGVDFPIDQNSYVLDGSGQIDGGDVSSQSYAHLLAMFPMFGNIYLNPLLTASHVAEIDLTASFLDNSVVPPATYPTRVQTGRGVATPGMPAGQMPTHTALLPFSKGVPPPGRPGMMISQEIDIGPYTLDPLGNPVGTDQFMLYWKLLGFNVTDDISSDYGALAGHNDPAIRFVEEVDQEPNGFSAYISPDNGLHWCPAGLLEPVTFAIQTTKFRVAFRNNGRNKVYMATFGVLF